MSEDKSVKLAKLDWYREVISLEPNTKLFLQLARLLAELGTDENNAQYINEAFEVLRRGLSINPDYMEARLFLIELLNLCGCKSQCGAEVARLASLFLSYPDFWDAWREYAITENESSDFTVALGFMSAIMRNKSLSIVQVLEAGLNVLRTNQQPNLSLDGIQPVEAPADFAKVEHIVQNVLQAPVIEKKEVTTPLLAEKQAVQPKVTYDETEESDSLHDVLPKEHVENYKNFSEQQKKKNVSAKQTLAELVKDANIVVEPSENSPFRTKSMADLLAEQGDYKGALDIYQELITKGYGDKKELQERIADIKNLCPELDVKIDPTKLLAIDDYVDTSFGLMAKKEGVSQEQEENIPSLDLPINDSYLSKDKNEKQVEDVISNEENEIIEKDTPLVDVPFVMPKKEEYIEIAQENELVQENEIIDENNAFLMNNEIVDEEQNNTVLDESVLDSSSLNANDPISFEEKEIDDNEKAELDAMLDMARISQDEKNEKEHVVEEDFSIDAMVAQDESDVVVNSAENIDVEEQTQNEEFEESDPVLDTEVVTESNNEVITEPELEKKQEQEVSMTKFNSDVADLLSKLAERLEVRAN